MRALFFTTFCSSSLMLAAPAALADVIDVGGPSPDFATIASAIAAAAEGDIIRVHAGSHDFFAVDAKSLTIIGVGDVEVFGTVRVRNLGMNQNVLLSGLDMNGADSRGFFAHDNAGLVVVQDCSLTGALTEPLHVSHEGGYALRCDRLVLVDTSATGSYGGGTSKKFDNNVDDGAHGFTSETSSVSVYGCEFQGGIGGFGYSVAGEGGSGFLNHFQSSLFAAGSIFRGGRGGFVDECDNSPGDGGLGGSGISVYPGGQVTVLDNEYFPGMGGFGLGPCVIGSPGMPIFGPATYLDGTLTRASLTPLAFDASLVTLHLTGPAGHNVRLAASPAAGFRFLPALGGVLHADPPSLVLITLAGSLDAAGVLDYDLMLPDLPPFGHAVWTTQSVVRDPGSGLFTLSSPRWTAILDSAW